MRVMRIYCPECDEVAVIKKTNRKHAHISDVYCACSNVECGHTFVMNMTFSHTLSPSAISHGHLIKELIGSIAEDKRQEMIDMLRMVQNDDSKPQINEKPTGQPSPSRYRRGG